MQREEACKLTLHHLSRDTTSDPGASAVDRLLWRLERGAVKIYQTRVGKTADGERVAMWRGDAGYEPWDADLGGARHRLVMTKGGFRFENDAEAY